MEKSSIRTAQDVTIQKAYDFWKKPETREAARVLLRTNFHRVDLKPIVAVAINLDEPTDYKLVTQLAEGQHLALNSHLVIAFRDFYHPYDVPYAQRWYDHDMRLSADVNGRDPWYLS